MKTKYLETIIFHLVTRYLMGTRYCRVFALLIKTGEDFFFPYFSTTCSQFFPHPSLFKILNDDNDI